MGRRGNIGGVGGGGDGVRDDCPKAVGNRWGTSSGGAGWGWGGLDAVGYGEDQRLSKIRGTGDVVSDSLVGLKNICSLYPR